MTNILSDDKRQQVLALGRLGWTLRRIERATGVRRETAGAYLKAAGLAVRPPGRWGHPAANPAIEVSTDPGARPPGISNPLSTSAPPGRAPAASACAPYRELIEAALARGRDAMAIWRDLIDDHGFPAQYASVRRFVITLRGQRPAEAHPVIVTAPGEEGQVDYGDGPMVRHPETGKYRRTRLFVFTLGYSRKSVRLLTFTSRTRRWAELHEETFRRLGGAVKVVVLDNLREGVLTPDLYDPTLNPLYDDVTVAPDWIATLKRALDGHPQADCVGGRVLPRGGSDRAVVVRSRSLGSRRASGLWRFAVLRHWPQAPVLDNRQRGVPAGGVRPDRPLCAAHGRGQRQ
jgi:transposase